MQSEHSCTGNDAKILRSLDEIGEQLIALSSEIETVAHDIESAQQDIDVMIQEIRNLNALTLVVRWLKRMVCRK